MKYDVVVVGGGPSGATAAEDLARSGHTVAMIDKRRADQALRRGHPARA